MTASESVRRLAPRSNTLTADFYVEALQEAFERLGVPEIFISAPMRRRSR
jgi:hypothetical protein